MKYVMSHVLARRRNGGKVGDDTSVVLLSLGALLGIGLVAAKQKVGATPSLVELHRKREARWSAIAGAGVVLAVLVMSVVAAAVGALRLLHRASFGWGAVTALGALALALAVLRQGREFWKALTEHSLEAGRETRGGPPLP